MILKQDWFGRRAFLLPGTRFVSDSRVVMNRDAIVFDRDSGIGNLLVAVPFGRSEPNVIGLPLLGW